MAVHQLASSHEHLCTWCGMKEEDLLRKVFMLKKKNISLSSKTLEANGVFFFSLWSNYQFDFFNSLALKLMFKEICKDLLHLKNVFFSVFVPLNVRP